MKNIWKKPPYSHSTIYRRVHDIVWVLMKGTEKSTTCNSPAKYIYSDSSHEETIRQIQIGGYSRINCFEHFFFNVSIMKTKQKSWRIVLDFLKDQREMTTESDV